MLAIEKFLKDQGVNKTYPVPDASGTIAYRILNSNKTWDYNFCIFKWENTKSHPSYYNFKYYNVLCHNEKNCYLNTTTKYVGWSRFFQEIENIKLNLQKNKQFHIAKNTYEMGDYIWRAFLQTQDATLANYIKNLPAYFFDSIDDKKTEIQRYDSRRRFIDYLDVNLNFVFYSWQNFVSEGFFENFCLWFHNYMHDV